jgi:hypothetical protein
MFTLAQWVQNDSRLLLRNSVSDARTMVKASIGGQVPHLVAQIKELSAADKSLEQVTVSSLYLLLQPVSATVALKSSFLY